MALLHAGNERIVHLFADGAAGGGDDLVVELDALALIGEGHAGHFAALIYEHGGYDHHGILAEVSGGIVHGEVCLDAVFDHFEYGRFALHGDLADCFCQLIGSAFAAGSEGQDGRCDC